MSLVNSRVGPASVKEKAVQQQCTCACIPICCSLTVFIPGIIERNPDIPRKTTGLPMALRAWLSSRLNALIGTSSHTGRTATVERLLAGLVTSALAVILGRLRAEPGRQEGGAFVPCLGARSQRRGAPPYLRTARDPAASCPGSSGQASGSTSSPPAQTHSISTTWSLPTRLKPRQGGGVVADLGVPSFDVVEGSLGKLDQLRVSHGVDGGGSRLSGQGLHLKPGDVWQWSKGCFH